LRCRKTGEAKTILFSCSGHGNFDLSSYEAYFAGSLVDYEYPAELIKESLSRLPVTG
ncbi:MAG: TrpB-like pyridoxal-phosphate dependent enzyme, partial [Methanoculleus thermophilus]|nr:TrpB-like pyridoxal-phosphate dependent enzyme [Methanoculleus thermophilus]